jgi:hypothetical protein
MWITGGRFVPNRVGVMKKTYILIFEFEAEIKEKVNCKDKKKKRYLNFLLAEFLKKREGCSKFIPALANVRFRG